MAKFKHIFYVVLLIALFVEVLIIFPDRLEKAAEKEKEAKEHPAEAKGPSGPEQRMRGMHVVESQGGKRDWELFANEAEGGQGNRAALKTVKEAEEAARQAEGNRLAAEKAAREKAIAEGRPVPVPGKALPVAAVPEAQLSGTWNLHQVRALFYNNEKVEFTVTGDEGSVDPKTKDLKIRGNVVTKSVNGYTFETPSIFYNAGTRIIQSPEQVVMKGPKDENGAGLLLEGAAMIVNVDSSKIMINSTVTAQKTLKENKQLQIRSDRAEFSGKNRQAHFLGNVSMNYDKMKIEGPQADFVYQANKDELSTILVKGGVKVSDVDKFATSENLNLDVLANKFTFRGKPKIIQNDDELVGDEITFLDGGKRVKVDKVRARMESATSGGAANSPGK